MYLYIHGHTHKCICTHMNTHRYNCTHMHTYLTHFCICTYMPTYPTCRGNCTQTQTYTHTSEGPQPLELTARLTVKNKRKQSKEKNNAVKGYSRDLGDAQRDRGLENKVSLKAKSPKSIPSPNLVTIKGTKNSLPFKLLHRVQLPFIGTFIPLTIWRLRWEGAVSHTSQSALSYRAPGIVRHKASILIMKRWLHFIYASPRKERKKTFRMRWASKCNCLVSAWGRLPIIAL